MLKSEIANGYTESMEDRNDQQTKLETASYDSKPINLQTTEYSLKKKPAHTRKIKVDIAQSRQKISTYEFGVQVDANPPKEVILTEEKLEEIKEAIVSSLICELNVNRRTINLLTDNQEVILNKMGKFMGDLYYSGPVKQKQITSVFYKSDTTSPELVLAKEDRRYKKPKHVVKMYNGGGNMSYNK